MNGFHYNLAFYRGFVIFFVFIDCLIQICISFILSLAFEKYCCGNKD